MTDLCLTFSKQKSVYCKSTTAGNYTLTVTDSLNGCVNLAIVSDAKRCTS
jgi:hypothetical protein